MNRQPYWTLIGVFLWAAAVQDNAVAAGANPPCRVEAAGDQFQIRNVSEKPVAALMGTFEYTAPVSRKVVTTPWTYHLGGVFLGKSGLAPGTVRALPPNRHYDPAHGMIQYRNVEVRAVVFANGSSWGPDEARLRLRLRSHAEILRANLHQIRDRLNNDPWDRIEGSILSVNNVLFDGKAAEARHLAFRQLLTDSDGRLRSDAPAVVNELIERVNAFLNLQ